MARLIDTHIITTPGLTNMLDREFSSQTDRSGHQRSPEDRRQVLALKTAFRALLRRQVGPDDASVMREPGGILDLWRRMNTCLESRGPDLGAHHPGVLSDLQTVRQRVVPEVWGTFLNGPTDLVESWDAMRLTALDATAPVAQRSEAQFMQDQLSGPVIGTMYRHLSRQVPDWDGDGRIRLGLQERLSRIFLAPRQEPQTSWLQQLVNDVTSNPALRITPQWLHLQHLELHDLLFREIVDPESTIPHWYQILTYLPQSLLTQVNVESFFERHESLSSDQLEWLRSHRDLAAILGPSVLADVMSQEFKDLASGQKIDPRVIMNYLGSLSRNTGPIPGQVAAIRPELFDRYPMIRDIVCLALRRNMYEHLLQFEERVLAGGENVTQAHLSQELPRIISTHFRSLQEGSPIHRELLVEVQGECARILSIPLPKTLNPTIRDGRGTVHRVPSLRQLFGMNDVKERERMLFPWPMGKGKTLGAILAAEHVQAKKIIYVCPTNLINEMPAKIEGYYTPEYRETLRREGRQLLGVIRAGMTPDAVLAVIACSKIVMVPYSMLYQTKKINVGDDVDQDVAIRELLQRAKFDFAIADEVHNAKNTNRRTGADDPDLTLVQVDEDVLLSQHQAAPGAAVTTQTPVPAQTGGGRYTQELYDLLCHEDTPHMPRTTIQHLVLASGFVVPNKPDDIAAQLRLLYPSQFRGDRVRTLREWINAVNPLALRAMLAKSMLNLDPLPDWEHYQHQDSFNLSASEIGIIQRIIARNDLTISQKITMVMLSMFNPSLIEPNHTQQPTMVREYASRIYNQIKKCGVSFCTESLRRQGIMTNDDPQKPLTYQKPPFVKLVIEEVRRLASADSGARFPAHQIDHYEIHGDTSLADQEHILRMARFPAQRVAADIFAPLRTLTQSIRANRNGLRTHRDEMRNCLTGLLQHLPADVCTSLINRLGVDSPVERQLRDALTQAGDSFEGFLRVVTDPQRPEFTAARTWLQDVQSQVPQRGLFVTVWASMMIEGRNLTPIKEGLVFEPMLRLPDLIQWLMRFAREGHEQGVQFTLPMPNNTLHNAILKNALYKFASCSALVQGGDFSPETLRLLEQGDVDLTISLRNGQLSFGPFADSLLNLRQRLHVLRDHYTGMGEDAILQRIRIEGEEYADLCRQEWDQGGSLSENGANDVSSVLTALRRDGVLKGTLGADLGAGLCVLESTYGVNHPDMKITSVDVNPHSLNRGADIVRRRRGDPNYCPRTLVGGMTNLNALDDGQFDFMTSLHAIHELSQSGRTQFASHERARVLEQMNHKLKLGGVLILTLPHQVCTRAEFDAFVTQMPHFGYEVQQTYTGLHRPVINPAPGSIPDWNSPQWLIALKKVAGVEHDQIQLKALSFSGAEQSGTAEVTSASQFPSNYPHAFTVETSDGESKTQLDVKAERTSEHISSEKLEREYRLALAKARLELVLLSRGLPENLMKLDKGIIADLEKRGIRLHYHMGKDRQPLDIIRFSIVLPGHPERHATYQVFEKLGGE